MTRIKLPRQHRGKLTADIEHPIQKRALSAMFGAAAARNNLNLPITLAPVKGPTLDEIEKKYGK